MHSCLSVSSSGTAAFATVAPARCKVRLFFKSSLHRPPTLLAGSQRKQKSCGCQALPQRRRQFPSTVATYPEPETEKERSPLDFPQEWVTPAPSKRMDVQPEFEKLETPLPKPLPGDPEQPDEEEEEEEKKKKKKNPDDPEEEEPDKEKPGPLPDTPE